MCFIDLFHVHVHIALSIAAHIHCMPLLNKLKDDVDGLNALTKTGNTINHLNMILKTIMHKEELLFSIVLQMLIISCLSCISKCVAFKAMYIYESQNDVMQRGTHVLVDCIYTTGAKPRQNPGHKASSNGCGSFGLKVCTLVCTKTYV